MSETVDESVAAPEGAVRPRPDYDPRLTNEDLAPLQKQRWTSYNFYFLCNLVARPSQATGTPYPVISRVSFGVLGANIPAIIRGLIAVAWYGIQTYLASASLVVVALKLWPGLAPYADADLHGFTGLSPPGWVAFLLMWAVQAAVFWKGMEAIRRSTW
jgi:NCS1 family nucleobase:cation symporter-1